MVVFSEPPRSSPQQDPGALGSGNGPPVPPLIDTGNAITYTDEYGNVAADNSTARELPTVIIEQTNKDILLKEPQKQSTNETRGKKKSFIMRPNGVN